MAKRERSNYCNYYEIMQNAYAISGNSPQPPSESRGNWFDLTWRSSGGGLRTEKLKTEKSRPKTGDSRLETQETPRFKTENKYNCECSPNSDMKSCDWNFCAVAFAVAIDDELPNRGAQKL